MREISGLGAIATFAERRKYFGRVLAEKGRGAAQSTGRLRELHGNPEGACRSGRAMVEFSHHFARTDLRIGENLIVGLHRTDGHARSRETIDPILRSASKENVVYDRDESKSI